MAYPKAALAQLCAARGTNLRQFAGALRVTPQHLNAARNGGPPLARRHLPAAAAAWKCSERTAARELERAGVRLGKRR